jgi:hypothetical protein
VGSFNSMDTPLALNATAWEHNASIGAGYALSQARRVPLATVIFLLNRQTYSLLRDSLLWKRGFLIERELLRHELQERNTDTPACTFSKTPDHVFE